MEIEKQNETMRKEFLKNSDNKLNDRTLEIERLRKLKQAEEERLDNHTKKIVEYEIRRNGKLQKEFEDFRLEKQNEILGIATEQKGSLAELQHGYDSKLKMLDNKKKMINENAKKYGENFLSKIELEEAEHEKEIQMKIKHYQKLIADETRDNQKLEKKGEELLGKNTKSKAKDVKTQKEFEELVIRNTEKLEEKVKICISLLKKQEQLLEREQVVFSKDETIRNARDEQINLENFRFMLDQKIKSLTSNKSKLVEEIDKLEKILRDMFNELIRQSQMNSTCYMSIDSLLKKLEIMNEQKKGSELQIYFWNTKMKEYHRKLTSALSSDKAVNEVGTMINNLLVKNKMINIAAELRSLSQEDLKKKLVKMGGNVSTNVHEELLNQNKWLLKKLHMLDTASKQIRRIRDENIEMGLSQNKKLIEECNKLKIENKFLSDHKKTIKDIIDKAINTNKRFMNEKQKIREAKDKLKKKNLIREIANKQVVSSASSLSKKSIKRGKIKLPKITKGKYRVV